jgi:hypothetical protein
MVAEAKGGAPQVETHQISVICAWVPRVPDSLWQEGYIRSPVVRTGR